MEYWSIVAAIFVLVVVGGIVAGLTIGLMSLDETNLSILKVSGTPAEKSFAARIEPIRRNTHLLLVTLLLTNTVVNETLPVLFDAIHLEGWQAVLCSTGLILVFGEIIPQAVCARYGLQIGAFFAWPVRILINLLWIIAYPIAQLLDAILGHKHGVIYRRAEFKELVALHGEDKAGTLTKDEVSVLRAVLELRDKSVGDVMTKLDDVFMLPLSATLDLATMKKVCHSRVPVYDSDNRNKVIGVVLVKQLIVFDPADSVPVKAIKIRTLPRVIRETPLFEMLHIFEEGGSHMALVVDEVPYNEAHACVQSGEASCDPDNGVHVGSSPLWPNASNGVPSNKAYRTLGIVTLEDVIEELLGEEIIDETDVYVDMATKVKVARALGPEFLQTWFSPRLSTSDMTPGSAVEPMSEADAERQPLLAPTPIMARQSSASYRAVQPAVSDDIRRAPVVTTVVTAKLDHLFILGAICDANPINE
eukprot:jgi/Hompol1/4983/HPOL_004106-RA